MRLERIGGARAVREQMVRTESHLGLNKVGLVNELSRMDGPKRRNAMNTKTRIRLLLIVLAFGLAAPCVASADSIPIAYVIYQNDILPGAGDDNPGTNAFYFEWLVDPLVFSEASFSVAGIDAAGAPTTTGPVSLGLPIDDSSALGALWFPSSARLTSARFRGLLAPGVLTFEGSTYAVAAQEVSGEMVADSLTAWPFGLDGGGDVFYLDVEAVPVTVPVPEPATFVLVAGGALLAAARRKLARRVS